MKVYPKKLLSCGIGMKYCDRKGMCSILSQCMFTLKRVEDNPALMKALKGPHSYRQILKIFRDHDPYPMKSYYYHTKYFKK